MAGPMEILLAGNPIHIVLKRLQTISRKLLGFRAHGQIWHGHSNIMSIFKPASESDVGIKRLTAATFCPCKGNWSILTRCVAFSNLAAWNLTMARIGHGRF